MKLTAWLISGMLCLSTAVIAQEEQEEEKPPKPFYLNLGKDDKNFIPGIIFGGNTGTIKNDNYPGFHNLSYTAGFTVYVRLAPGFWVGPELLFVKRGVTGVRTAYSTYVGDYFEKYYLKMSTTEVPIVFHAMLPSRPWYHVSFGLSYWRIINSKESLLTYPDPIYPDQELYYFNKNNFDYVIGGGLHINKKLFLNVRYQGSIIPIRNYAQVHPYVGAGNQYMTMCSLQLMYLFRGS